MEGQQGLLGRFLGYSDAISPNKRTEGFGIMFLKYLGWNAT